MELDLFPWYLWCTWRRVLFTKDRFFLTSFTRFSVRSWIVLWVRWIAWRWMKLKNIDGNIWICITAWWRTWLSSVLGYCPSMAWSVLVVPVSEITLSGCCDIWESQLFRGMSVPGTHVPTAGGCGGCGGYPLLDEVDIDGSCGGYHGGTPG